MDVKVTQEEKRSWDGAQLCQIIWENGRRKSFCLSRLWLAGALMQCQPSIWSNVLVMLTNTKKKKALLRKQMNHFPEEKTLKGNHPGIMTHVLSDSVFLIFLQHGGKSIHLMSDTDVFSALLLGTFLKYFRIRHTCETDLFARKVAEHHEVGCSRACNCGRNKPVF